MKANIEVENRKEAELIRTGLDDPSVRAFVVTMGALQSLPGDPARRRVLQYVMDYFAGGAGMTIEQFDKVVGYLIQIVLPPSCNDDPPIIADSVIEILEKHCEEIRGTIIRHRVEGADEDV